MITDITSTDHFRQIVSLLVPPPALSDAQIVGFLDLPRHRVRCRLSCRLVGTCPGECHSNPNAFIARVQPDPVPQAILPTLTKLSEDYRKLNFYKVDVDEHAQLTQMAGARIYPTIIVYRRGTKVGCYIAVLRSARMSKSFPCSSTPSLEQIPKALRSVDLFPLPPDICIRICIQT